MEGQIPAKPNLANPTTGPLCTGPLTELYVEALGMCSWSLMELYIYMESLGECTWTLV